MKLLFITRRVDKDDGLAGFTYFWLTKFAAKVEKLEVICLEKGNIEGLPTNVQIHSLGKEKGKARLREFFRFQRLASKLVPTVDGIFAHQNPEYGILIAPWAKAYHKTLIAWYAHGSVSTKLKILTRLADKIVTSTESGFRLASNKKIVLHQGINTDLFNFQTSFSTGEIVLLSVSRLGRTKNIDLMLDLVKVLKTKTSQKITLNIIGEASLAKDKEYLEQLQSRVSAEDLKNNVNFLGSIANRQTPHYYHQADVFLNFSQTGSLDKTILESMSCGTFVLTTNSAAREILVELNFSSDTDANSLADKIINFVNLATTEKENIVTQARRIVEQKHSLELLAQDIVALYEKNL